MKVFQEGTGSQAWTVSPDPREVKEKEETKEKRGTQVEMELDSQVHRDHQDPLGKSSTKSQTISTASVAERVHRADLVYLVKLDFPGLSGRKVTEETPVLQASV